MKRELSVLVPLALLGAAFVLVSLLVTMTRGNSWLVARKLRIGAMIIGLNAAAAGCFPPFVTCYDPGPTCYDPPAEHVCLIEESEECMPGEVRLEGDAPIVLVGVVSSRESDAYSFRIVGPDEEVLQRGDALPRDGAFDSSTEEFEITIDPSSLPAGELLLELWAGSVDSVDQGNGRLVTQYQLIRESVVLD
jgi:hypothetical protein